MPITALSDVLWYWDAVAGVQPIFGGDPTFTRASSGLVVADRAYRVRSVPADYPRFPWVTAGEDRLPAMLLEAARTNVLLDSEDFSGGDWSSVSAPTVTANDIVAPDGTLTADRIEDDAAGAAERRYQAVTVPNDSNPYAASVFVKKTASTGVVVALQLSFTGGTGVTEAIVLDPADGSTETTGGEDRAGVEDLGDWWRLWIVASNNGTGNTTCQVDVAPAWRTDTASAAVDNTATGANHFWGAQLEQGAYPTSYSGETTTSSVTRAVESMQWNGAPDPQAMVIYLEVVLVNPTIASAGRFFTIGESATAGQGQQVFVRETNTGIIRLELRSDANTVTSQLSIGSAVPGDRLQLVCVLNADGSGRIVSSLNGASAVGNSLSAPADGLPSVWSADTVWFNSGGSLFVNSSRYRQFKIVKPGDVDAALDGSEDDDLVEEMAALTVNQFGQVRTS